MNGRTKRRLGAAIVGAGFMGSVHGRAARLNGADVIGICAARPERARAAAATLDTQAFDDVEELVAHSDVDVVHVCTPNDLHVPVTRAALEAGKHVVCEKPLALDAAAAEELAASVAEVSLVGAVPFVYRYHPMVREARARVAAGALGPIHLIHGTYLQDWLLDPSDTSWRVDSARGGRSRAFADIGCHWCDLVEFVSGEEIVEVSALLEVVIAERAAPERLGTTSFSRADDTADVPMAPVETEDLALVHLRFRSGGLGTVVISQVSAGHKNRLQFDISGRIASLSFDQESPEALRIADRDGVWSIVRDPSRLSPEAARYATLPAGHPQGYNDCFEAFVGDVYAAIGGEPVEGMPSFSDGARGVLLTDAVLASAAEGGRWALVSAQHRTTMKGSDMPVTTAKAPSS